MTKGQKKPVVKGQKKTVRKLKKLSKKGKLKRHTVDKFKDIKARKSADSRKRALDIEDDWVSNVAEKRAEDEDDDILPLDMLDADLEWSSTGFAEKKKRYDEERMTFDENPRSFGDDDSEMRQMLPIKLAGGQIVAMSRKVDSSDRLNGDGEAGEDDKDAEAATAAPADEDNDEGLSAIELITKRRKLMEEYRGKIASAGHQLMIEPQEQIGRLKELLRLAAGEEVKALVRESVQKLATASLCQVFTDLIPGYHIRLPTEQELAQKLKKDTKQLYEFESSLLRNYKKYLQLLENFSKPLKKRAARDFQKDSATFTDKMAFLSVDCLCRLLVERPHFNFRANIITVIVELTTCGLPEIIDKCCNAIKAIFKDDISGETSLEGTRAIAQLVQQKSVAIAPELLNCLLSLRIKQIDSGEKDKEKEALMSKKYQLKKERKSKKSQKYDKQLKKLEQELKEVEAAQNQSTKLKLNTQTMKHAFTTYFRVIRRMPKSALLTPVLEGLSKFAHLINVEFFDDLISSMHHLVEQGDLKPLDSLHCINTVFVILSGEGQALNIDPYRFYRSIYSLLPRIALEKNANQQRRQAALALRTLEIMLNVRRRQVSIGRVAAFIKRMALLCFALRTDVLISFLAALRTYFVAHPRLSEQLLDAETQDAGRYLAAVEDPDHCNAQSATIIDEMTALAMHPDITVRQFALHIRHKLPSLGNHRLQPSVATKKPWTWPKEDMAGDDDEALPFADAITFGKKRKNAPLLSISVCARIEAWLQEKK